MCDCSDEQKCGENCVNRSIFVECMAATCRHKDGCQNQRLQNAKFPRSSIKKAGNRGFGLYAMEDIMPDTIVAEYTGEVITTDEFLERTKKMTASTPFYFMSLDSDLIIDAGECGSLARFINHSCDFNCCTEKWSVGAETRVAIKSVRAIRKGEELSYDYQTEVFRPPFR